MSRLTALFVLVPAFVSYGEVWNVPNDAPTIQIAISKAQSGDTIIVEPGTYLESLNYDGKSLTIQSTDPLDPDVVTDTIIDAGGLGTVVTFLGPASFDASLDGFTITGGTIGIDGKDTRASVSNCIVRDNAQHGIFKLHGAIEHCVIRDNSSLGIYDCDGLISHCTVMDNNSGLYYCDGIIEDCWISGRGYGMSQSSGATISRCVIVNNDSAGMYQCDNSMMSRLLVSGNGNYGIYDCDLGVIENSVIAGNRISGFIQSTINVLSCTVVGNLAYGFQSHTGDIDHTIIWNNPNGPLTSSSTPVFSATFDPYFVRSGHWSGDFWNEGDYHLMPDSRVIDAGNPSYGNDPNEDLDGNPRIVGSRVDIGAYEFQTPCEGADFDGDGLADPCDPDIDDDGVSNTLDPCDFTPLGIAIDSDGRPRGDLNLDCKVDLRDAAIMQRSLTGP